MATPQPFRIVVVGAGPAGLVAGLLLARAGAQVVILEKHADFLRDFRGDTVHASTLTLLDELGLGERFQGLPHRLIDRAQIQLDGGTVTFGDLTHLPGAHQHIALVPQWDLLEMLASAGAEEPTFELRRSVEVVDVTTRGGRVTGVRTDSGNDAGDIAADLVIACDGRDSTVRDRAGLTPRRFGFPIDVEWFRLPRRDGDPAGLQARMSSTGFVVLIDRGDYWQIAYLVFKGGDAPLRARGIGVFRARLAELLPWLSDRTGDVQGWDDVRLLSVSLDRLRRWYAPGLLLIGDAAHAMSPVGGVGINLAVQDAVAAARLIGDRLRSGRVVDTSTLRAVQLRRWWPTALVQFGQRMAHRVLSRAVRTEGEGTLRPLRLPRALAIVTRIPHYATIPGYLIGIGPLPEHAPDWARR